MSSIGQSALYKESIVVKYGFSTALLTLEEDGLKLTILYEPVPWGNPSYGVDDHRRVS